MFTGKTKSGFVYCIPEKRIQNMELLDALTELETNGAALPKVVNLLLDFLLIWTFRRMDQAYALEQQSRESRQILQAQSDYYRQMRDNAHALSQIRSEMRIQLQVLQTDGPDNIPGCRAEIFFHPDCTVGTGITPVQLALADFTAGREFRPALKIDSIVPS